MINFYFLISILLFDLYSFYPIKKNNYKTISNIEYEINNNFGYYPKKNSVFEEKIFYKDKLINFYNYTINNFGHRKVYNKNYNQKKCLVFHGGSIAFGQSLNDDETLPYQVRKLFEDKFKVFNFAFNGYGPHQFLSKLENNYLNELNMCEKLIIIYQFIPDHVGRTSGRRSWGEDSPRYIFKNNILLQRGFFSNYPFKIIMKIRKNFRNSKTISLIYNVRNVNNKDKEIFLKIIKKIESVSKKNFNKVKFIYIIWDENIGVWKSEKNKLKNIYDYYNNSIFINIDDLQVKEEYKKNKIPEDQHPTKEYNYILAKELFLKINNIKY